VRAIAALRARKGDASGDGRRLARKRCGRNHTQDDAETAEAEKNEGEGKRAQTSSKILMRSLLFSPW
jgi:hypothetical protein